MPYLTQDVITERALGRIPARNPGELNYDLTGLLVRYIVTNGLSYQTINDVLGALEGAKQEFYSRIAVPYEEHKRKTNGDVYHTVLRMLPRGEAQ